ncbi:MAG TPA: ABC transporter permease [Tepidisphaeraceae bacterium]|jgi:ABC-2 type transport system permease protein
MTRAGVIAKRELSSYFYSPIAYVAMTLFLLASGSFFFNDFQPGQPASMRTLFEWMAWLLVFIIPVLCMGLLAQEWTSGTIETLMTAPVDESDVIVGKFLGSFGFFVVLLLPTLFYVVMLRIYSQPDFGPIFSGYLGILLVGALFISIGLFCSSLTRSHVIAAVMAVAILCAVTILPWIVTSFANIPDLLRRVMDQTVYRRYTDFSKGVIDFGNLIFFIATTTVFLFLTTKVLESRRWK